MKARSIASFTLGILALAVTVILYLASPARAGGSDSLTPYTVGSQGITLPAGVTFPSHGHVNLKTADGRTFGLHFDPNAGHPGAEWIGESFLPYEALGLSAATACVSWVQLSLYNEHFGEGGQSPVGLGCAPVSAPVPEPVPTPPPSAPEIPEPEVTPTAAPEPSPACGPIGSCGEVPIYVDPSPSPTSVPAEPGGTFEAVSSAAPLISTPVLAETGTRITPLMIAVGLAMVGTGVAHTKGTPMKTPDLMPILSAGAHKSPADGACIMEYASLLAGEPWTDRPKCTHPLLAEAARTVNDKLGDKARQALLPLLPRLMGTASGDEAVGGGSGVFAARYVLHLVPAEYRSVCERAIDAAEAVAEGTGTKGSARAAALGAADAVRATHAMAGFSGEALAAAYAVRVTVDATRGYVNVAVIHAAEAASIADLAKGHDSGAADAELVAFLTALIDEYDRLTGRGQVAPLTESDLKVLQEATK